MSDASACPWTGAEPQVWVTWFTWGLFVSFPARADEEQMPSMMSPSFQPSVARNRYTAVLDTAEVAQQVTKPMTSHQSSLTSLEESRPSELLPRKVLLRAGGSHAEVSVLVGWCLSSVPGLCSPWLLPDTAPVSAAVKPAHQSAFEPSATCPLLTASLQSCGLCSYVSV